MPAAARGRPPGSRVKPWEDAIRLCALRKDKDGITELYRIAQATIEAAKAGDISAVKEIGDRLDGKAAQPVTDGEGGPLTVQILRLTGNG